MLIVVVVVESFRHSRTVLVLVRTCGTCNGSCTSNLLKPVGVSGQILFDIFINRFLEMLKKFCLKTASFKVNITQFKTKMYL
jgi:hypothetical protein